MDRSQRCGLSLLAVLACVGTSSQTVCAQAPASAQVWDVVFAVDSSGPLSAGPFATAVGITVRARVAIRPNFTSIGNFGVFRVGGVSSSGFRMTFADPGVPSSDQGTLVRGQTGEQMNGGETLTDLDGAALSGHFAPFRGNATITRNTSPGNGTIGAEADGSAFITDVSGGRAGSYSGPLGDAIETPEGTLAGEYADVYRMVYVPKEGLTGAGLLSRIVTVQVRNLSVRYIYSANGNSLLVSPALTLADRSFSFQIPSAGGAALLAAAGAVAVRRRR